MTIWLDMLGADMRTLETPNFGKVRYAETGRPGAPVIIFQHGLGGHLEAYSKNIAALGDEFHVLAFDYAGHGLSERKVMEYTPPILAEQLGEFMDVLGIERAHLSGESLGGWVSGFFAIKYPQRVERLMLNTAGGVPISAKGRIDMENLMALSKKVAGQPPTYQSVKDRIGWLIHPSNHHLITDELVNLRLFYYTMPEGREVMPLVNRILPRHDEFLLPLEEIKAKTMLLWTRDNPIHDLETAKMAHERMQGSILYVMEADGAHWPQYEAPDEFNQVCRDFFSGRMN
jgi:HOMODA hydrolase